MTIQSVCSRVFISVAIAALGMFLEGVPGARAQTGNAAVAGVVSDTSGAATVGAKMVLTNTLNGDKLTETTGSNGKYTFPTVPPGNYSISASAPSFAHRVVSGVLLTLDLHLNESISLSLGATKQTVSVTAQASQVDTTAYGVGGVVTQNRIQNLPIQNRQSLNLGVLVPGMSRGANHSSYNRVQAGSRVYFYANGFYLLGVTSQQTEEAIPATSGGSTVK